MASTGNNANPCSRSAPCATLQRAVSQADANGEVQILDSGTFGGAVIDKSLTVTAVSEGATLGTVIINRNGAIVALKGLHVHGHNARAIATSSATRSAR